MHIYVLFPKIVAKFVSFLVILNISDIALSFLLFPINAFNVFQV